MHTCLDTAPKVFNSLYSSNRCVPPSASLSLCPLLFGSLLAPSVAQTSSHHPHSQTPTQTHHSDMVLSFFSADELRWLSCFTPCLGLCSTHCNYFRQKQPTKMCVIMLIVAHSPQVFFLLSVGSSGQEIVTEDNKLFLFISMIVFCGGITFVILMMNGNYTHKLMLKR